MVREAVPADVDTIYQFILDLAEYEQLSDAVDGSREDLSSHLFGPSPVCHAMIAEDEDGPAGFALFFTNYSTFRCKPGVYLEDLFVAPRARGRGHGKDLMQAIARYAVARGYARFEWSALNWNKPAIDFYLRLGAEQMTEWCVYRLTEDSLKNVAK